ncbi:MAG: amidohydrolase [Caldilineaceae bacterium SB0664_bin_27]|uniref:Amidohydrolase n=1 Tax=Caldilineaceae bacterium SB0664_bin_27 TaxID=2605260 RepID=A0A6B0YQG6_9CHLR|nr:amidohydrolase [Caldilineaceae bacterium SB0664_bin_27]
MRSVDNESPLSENGHTAVDRDQTIQSPGRERPPNSRAHSVIDCDIHNELSSIDQLVPYLADYWQEYIRISGYPGPSGGDYPRGAPISARPGSLPQGGGAAGSSLELVREQALAPFNTEIGILNCAFRAQSVKQEDLAVDLATAVNRWQIDEWLTPEPRLRGSLVVPSQSPARAAQEIDRFGEHPQIVQVVLPVRSFIPYGNRFYDPLYAAAIERDLIIAIHYGGSPGHPPSPVGWPSTYLEEYANMAPVFQSQVISLVAEGVFDRFPDLRIALIEGGFAWMPALMWRLDKEWKGLRSNVPWVRRPPSDYIRDHIRLTVQPVDTPPDPGYILQTIEQMESDTMLMFATDYPHWHYDRDEEAWPAALPEPLHANIWSENARAFYRFNGESS